VRVSHDRHVAGSIATHPRFSAVPRAVTAAWGVTTALSAFIAAFTIKVALLHSLAPTSRRDLPTHPPAHLAHEPAHPSCPCRGSVLERAQRLFAVKGLCADEVPAKLRGPGFPGPKLRG